MSKKEAEFLDDLRALSITAAHELLSGFDRLRQLRDGWEADEGGWAEEARARRERMKSLAFELARTEIRHAEKILSLSHAHADLLFEHAQRLVQQARSGGVQAPRVVDVEATGSELGTGVSASLEIKNPFGRDADPRFELSAFRTQSGDEVDALRGVVACEPPLVPARATAEVTVTVRAAGDAAVPPGVYFADLIVWCVGEVEQRVARRLVRLRVEAARPQENDGDGEG